MFPREKGARLTPTSDLRPPTSDLAVSPWTGRPLPSNSQIAKARIAAEGLAAAASPKSEVQSPKSPDTRNLSADLSRILRPQAAYRWLLPQLAAITPQYIEMTLRGALAGNHVQAWELFDLMLDSWPELGACCQELIEGVQRKTLIFEPYHEEDKEAEPEAIERMKVVSAALRNMQPDPAADENDLDGTIKDILSAWFVGQVVLEIDWEAPKQTGTLNTITTEFGDIIGPRSTYWVHPVCYAWSMEGRMGLRTELSQIRTTTQTATATSKDRRSDTGNTTWSSTSYQPRPSSVDDFPDYKFLIGIHKMKSGTALGGARLRLLAWYWCAANFSAEWLLNLAQLFGLPIRWANFDQNAPQETIDGICSMLEKMGTSAWGAFPTGTNLQILDGGAKTSGDHSPQGELLDRADRYARMVILGQTMTGGRGGMGKGGGQAFGAVEKDVKEDRIDAAGKYACGVIEQQLIRYILMVNYGDAANAPTARFLEKEEGGLEDAQRDTALAQGGLKIGVNFLRKKYGIPAPEKGEETIGGVSPQSTALSPQSGKPAAGEDLSPEEKLQKQEDALESRFADNEKVKALKPGESAVINEGDGDHFINYCSCGKTIGQCRCGSPNKKVTVTKDGCPECQAALETRSCGCSAHPLQARSSETDKLVNHVLENLTGVASKWLGGVKPFFRELLAKAQDKSVSDADLVKVIEHAQKNMPELFAKLDSKALSDALEHSMAAALVNGVVEGHLDRGRRPEVGSRNSKQETRNPKPETAT